MGSNPIPSATEPVVAKVTLGGGRFLRFAGSCITAPCGAQTADSASLGSVTTAPTIHSALGSEITAEALHAILALRSNIFIVEQDCVYNDIDGLDILATTRHLWMVAPTPATPAPSVTATATLRILSHASDPLEPTQIGRVATHGEHRGKGLAAHLIQEALGLIDGPAKLSAQSHLADWYAGFGFQTTGTGYLEDGIPHIAMTRP